MLNVRLYMKSNNHFAMIEGELSNNTGDEMIVTLKDGTDILVYVDNIIAIVDLDTIPRESGSLPIQPGKIIF